MIHIDTENKNENFSINVYGAFLALTGMLLFAMSNQLFSGEAFWQLAATALVPLITLAVARYIYALESVALNGLEKLSGEPMTQEHRIERLFYLKRLIYSSFIAFQHSYLGFAFASIVLWYRTPENGGHLEPLTLYFFALAGFMEWIRSIVKLWVSIR